MGAQITFKADKVCQTTSSTECSAYHNSCAMEEDAEEVEEADFRGNSIAEARATPLSRNTSDLEPCSSLEFLIKMGGCF